MRQNNIHNTIIFLITVSLFLSCNSQSKKEDLIMNNAKEIMKTYPDSAQTILESIRKPTHLDKAQYHRYLLLMLQAKDRNNRDITRDTAVFSTKHYYARRKDQSNAAIAAYYCGRIRFEQKNYKDAINQYMEAEKYAINSSNMTLRAYIQSAIGMVYSSQMLSEAALVRFRKSAFYFRQAGNKKNEMITYQLIGDSHLVKLRADSALLYFNKVLPFAQSFKDSINISNIKRNIGIIYKEIKHNSTVAKKYLFEAIQHAQGSNYAYICLKLADIYSLVNKKDSAEWYLRLSSLHIQDKSNLHLMADFYQASATIKERELNYKDALQNYKIYDNYLDSIFAQTRDIELIDIQNKYQFEKLTNKNMALILKNQKIFIYSALGILFSLLMILFYYRRYKLSKRREQEAENKIFHLMNMAESFDKKKNTFRNILLYQFDILKKTAMLKNYIHKGDENSCRLVKRFNQIVYGEDGLNWELLYKAMNDLHNGLFDRLHNKYANLDQDEFNICCLTYANFSSEEISIIMELSVNTIQMKRTSIRKKLGIPPMGNIPRFLDISLKHS